MKNYKVLQVCREGDSVLVKGVSDRDWIYISSTDQDELAVLLEKHRNPDRDRNYAVIEPWMEALILQGRDKEWELRCDKFYLPDTAVLPECSCRIRTLDTAHTKYIYENYMYRAFLEEEYIAERIKAGPAYAVFEGDKPAAWVMTHDDDAVGLLHVMPAFRGRGYARSLVSRISSELRAAGRMAFMHIEADNKASVNLALNCGYLRHSMISWFGISGS